MKERWKKKIEKQANKKRQAFINRAGEEVMDKKKERDCTLKIVRPHEKYYSNKCKIILYKSYFPALKPLRFHILFHVLVYMLPAFHIFIPCFSIYTSSVSYSFPWFWLLRWFDKIRKQMIRKSVLNNVVVESKNKFRS